MKNEFTFEDEPELLEDDEDLDTLRDDLESTKQLLELEVRSKKLLERDNKKLQMELERLRNEFHKMVKGEELSSKDANADPETTRARRNSVASKRQSMIGFISESVSSSNVPAMLQQQQSVDDTIDEVVEEEPTTKPAATGVGSAPETSTAPVRKEPLTYVVPNTEQELIDSMQEEVEEARRLAEDWEAKYKDMQRQMCELDSGRQLDGRRVSTSEGPGLQRMMSEDISEQQSVVEDDEEGWMLKREIHMLESKLRNIRDKREVAFRERKLLNERIDNIVANISQELEARKKLRKEVKEMNEAFKDEILEMEAEERTAAELEECYYSDEDDLVVSKDSRRRSNGGSDEQDDDEDEEAEEEEEDEDEDVDETLEDILILAEDDGDEEDPGHNLFENYPEEARVDEEDREKRMELLNSLVDKHHEYLLLMRKSNFMLKSKIDRLFDILQMQREKHRDIKQELARMLADIQ